MELVQIPNSLQASFAQLHAGALYQEIKMLRVAVPSDPPSRHLRKSSPYHADLRNKDDSTVRLEFAYCVPRTLNRTVPAYCSSVLFLKRTVPTCRTRTMQKKRPVPAFRTF